MRGEQLRIPQDIEAMFHMRGGDTQRLIEYDADGKNAPKYRPAHWQDWMKANTKPWRPPPANKKPLDLAKLSQLGLVAALHNGQEWSSPDE